MTVLGVNLLLLLSETLKRGRNAGPRFSLGRAIVTEMAEPPIFMHPSVYPLRAVR